MSAMLRDLADRFLGRGQAAVTVPALDGALKPNNLLEEAPIGFPAASADNLAVTGTGLIYSSEGTLYRQGSCGGPANAWKHVGEPVSALAVSANDVVAIAASSRILLIGTDGNERAELSVGSQPWAGVTALCFAADGSLLVAIGSARNGLEEWQRDLLDGGCSGSLWRIDLANGRSHQLAGKLHYPNGIAVEQDGGIIVSEAWQKRVLRLSEAGRVIGQVVEDLPGYPARISPSERGGYWLSVFAPRSQLIEFVLREPAYRKAMMAEVDKEFWIAPALRSGYSFREPMQGGALKQMGILKPWAPTRSYGLVVEFNRDFVPVRSFHSRAGGRRHGITSAVEAGGKLWATSKGGGEVVAIPLVAGGN
jgi:hypothetical protein